ncbi:NADH kinase pos5, partial [Perkinsus olseni]
AAGGSDGVEEEVILQQHVLNECVIARGAKAALQRFDFIVDGKYVTQFQGDGLIICTPSGSSAYSMAAGGSLVAPNVPCIMVTPIAPHGLNQRPLVLPASASIEIVIPRNTRSLPVACFDGAIEIGLDRSQRVRITTSKDTEKHVCWLYLPSH